MKFTSKFDFLHKVREQVRDDKQLKIYEFVVYMHMVHKVLKTTQYRVTINPREVIPLMIENTFYLAIKRLLKLGYLAEHREKNNSYKVILPTLLNNRPYIANLKEMI